MTAVLPGDIVLKYRPISNNWFKYFLSRSILFFTREWWVNENPSLTTHAEMVFEQINDDSYIVIDEEPPRVRFKTRSFNNRIIFRLKDKPKDFDKMFDVYVTNNFGRHYEYWKILLFVLDWIGHTKWFTEHWDLGHYYVCSEFVAKFYEGMGRQCSASSFKSTSPDDIFDFCEFNPDLFDIISDEWKIAG